MLKRITRQNSLVRVLIKVFWLVTYGARPFMQTHPRFLQQVFPKHNTKHFSITAWGEKRMYFCCSYKEPLMHALSSKKQKGSHSWLPSCRHHHHPPRPQQLMQPPYTAEKALLLEGLRKTPTPGHRCDQYQASSCAQPDGKLSMLSAVPMSHKVKKKANVSRGI